MPETKVLDGGRGVTFTPHEAQKPIAIAGVCFVAGSRREALRIATAALDCGLNGSTQHSMELVEWRIDV